MSFEEIATKMATSDFSPEDEEKFNGLSNSDKLEFYSFGKQGYYGDNNTDRPGMFDIVGKFKWNAWDSRRGMSCDGAKAKYMEKIEQMGFFKELTSKKAETKKEGAEASPQITNI